MGTCLRLGFIAGAVKWHFCGKYLVSQGNRTDEKMSGAGHLFSHREMNDRKVLLCR